MKKAFAIAGLVVLVLIAGVDAMIGRDFETGLANLKSAAEK
jgi:hypothetical protein